MGFVWPHRTCLGAALLVLVPLVVDMVPGFRLGFRHLVLCALVVLVLVVLLLLMQCWCV